MQDKFVLISDSIFKHAIALSIYILKYDLKINLAGYSITNIKEKLYYNTVFRGDLKDVLNKYHNKIPLVIPTWAKSVCHLVKIRYKLIYINDINKLNICFDYKPFNFDSKKAFNFFIYPLLIMDVNLKNDKNLDTFKNILEITKFYSGNLTFLYHNNYLRTSKEKRFFENLLKYI